MVVPDDQLRVDKNVPTENQCRQPAVNQLAGAAIGEEGSHESKQYESPQPAEQVGHPASEIVLGLASKGGEEDKDARGEEDSVEDDRGLVEGDDDGDGVGFKESEARQEEEVGRIGVAFPVGEEHHADGAEHLSQGAYISSQNQGRRTGTRKPTATYRDEHQSGMVLDPRLVALTHKAQCAHEPRHQQLHGQDRVDLADKLIADVDGRLGDAAAKLEVIGQVVIAVQAAARNARVESRLVVGGGLVGWRCLAVGCGGGPGPGNRVRVVLCGGTVFCVGHRDG